MPIDFHSAQNHNTYATRTADASWRSCIAELVNPVGKRVVDVGCGGDIYSRAWSELGANSVTGVDFSAQMVADAIDASTGYANVSFVQGKSDATGLPDASADIVFARAFIHHIPNLMPTLAEIDRILAPGGIVIIQDRTPDDVRMPASPEHLRGYFFERFPRLIEIETARRPTSTQVTSALSTAGYTRIESTSLAEVRRVYDDLASLRDDLHSRTGRSILHELTDDDLLALIDHISQVVEGQFPLAETDHWTIWSADRA